MLLTTVWVLYLTVQLYKEMAVLVHMLYIFYLSLENTPNLLCSTLPVAFLSSVVLLQLLCLISHASLAPVVHTLGKTAVDKV